MENLSDKTLNALYVSLVAEMREQGLPVVVVGGQACIEYGLAEFTKDLDIISPLEKCERIIEFLSEYKIGDKSCRYRFGHGSPLARPWLDGGWSSHFIFSCLDEYLEPCIDIFGVPPRVSGNNYGQGIFANLDVLAEMKKTKRPRDWAFVTSLGLKMLNAGDKTGLCFVYDEEKLKEAVTLFNIGETLLKRRPALRLALDENPLLSRTIKTEIEFWSVFDKKRLAIYKQAWEGYFRYLNKLKNKKFGSLMEEHEVLLENARRSLAPFPLNDYGVRRLIDETRAEVMMGIADEIAEYLPDCSDIEGKSRQLKTNYEKTNTH